MKYMIAIVLALASMTAVADSGWIEIGPMTVENQDITDTVYAKITPINRAEDKWSVIVKMAFNKVVNLGGYIGSAQQVPGDSVTTELRVDCRHGVLQQLNAKAYQGNVLTGQILVPNPTFELGIVIAQGSPLRMAYDFTCTKATAN